MATRKVMSGGFFPYPGSHDPLGRIVTCGLNTAANIAMGHGARWLDGKIREGMGLNGMSALDEIKLNQSRLGLKRQEVELERIQALSERQIRLLDMRIADKELELEQARKVLEAAKVQDASLQLPSRETVIAGALEVAADPEGLSGSPEQAEAYARWLDGFQEGKVALIAGRRGSGKTAFIAKLAEYMAGTFRMPCYWLGLPEQAKSLLPNWITMVDDAYKCPVNSFIVCDEAGINFLSLLFQDKRAQFMRRLLMVCRQRHCSLAFAVQNTKDVDLAIVRQADSIIFKQPGMHQPETERPDIRPLVRKASEAFSKMTKEEALESAYVVDDDFQGVLKFTPPSFWTEDFSHVYAHLDLMAIEREAEIRKGLRSTIADASHQIEETSFASKVFTLRRQNMGYEAIAKNLCCTVHQVRKILEPIERESKS